MSNIELGFNPQVRQALSDFQKARELAKEAEALKAQAEAILREALGENLAGNIGGAVAFKIEKRSRTNINAETLKVEFPDAYEASKSVTEYDFIKVV